MDLINDKYYKHMEMTIDNSNHLITFNTDFIEKIEHNMLGSLKEGNYIITNRDHEVKNPTGGLLFSFINADFETLTGFSKFIKTWGLSGLIEVNAKTDKPYYDYRIYGPDERGGLLSSFYELTKDALKEAQNNFNMVIDYCINAEHRQCLQDLTQLQRYYVCRVMDMIPDLDIYSGHLYFSHDVVKGDIINDVEDVPIIRTIENNLDALCNSIKNDEFDIKATYHSRNILTFVYIEFFNVIRNFSIGKCDNCNNYFVPKTKITEIYCEACRGIGYINKVKNDELLKAYNTAYKTKHAQKQRAVKNKSNETHKKYENSLKKWREEAKLKLSLAQSDKDFEKDFFDFLSSKLEV